MTMTGSSVGARSSTRTGALTALLLALAALGSPAASTANDEVTFTKDVAPILHRSCLSCHRPDSVAPMSLISYDQVRPWARSIKKRTALRNKPGVMPPWYIERDIGIQQFKDDPSLSESEIATIARWVDRGAPEGDPADLPPTPVFSDADEWEIGEPDWIVSTKQIEVAALAPDWWGSLGAIPLGLTEDRYVAAVEYRERNTSSGTPSRDTVGGLFVIHHAGPMVIGADGQMLGVWPVHEVGRNADYFQAEAGRLLKAGSSMVLPSVHLHSNGTDTTARLEIGFKFHPKGYEPTKQTQFIFFGNGPDLDIRGMDPDQRIDAYYTLPRNTRVSVFEPHMHASGVRMCIEAIWGVTTRTLNCAGYDHNWVRVYHYAEDAAPLLPKGTILHLVGYFNNSPSNPNVADPRNWAGAGHRSVDNMFINLMQGTYLTDDEFQEEVARRREYLQLTGEPGDIACPLCGSQGDAVAGGAGGR
jgi:hypothetical protein